MSESNEIARSFALNYNIGERLRLHMEKAVIGDMAGLGFGALKFVADISEGIVETFTDTQANSAVTDYFQNTYAAHINYKESLGNHMQSTLPEQIPWKDVSMSNIGEVSAQLFADNSFSILSALTYGGAVAAATKLGTAAVGYTVPQASRMLMQTFFAVEGGAKLSEMEIAQKNATQNISILQRALSSAPTQDERLQIWF